MFFMGSVLTLFDVPSGFALTRLVSQPYPASPTKPARRHAPQASLSSIPMSDLALSSSPASSPFLPSTPSSAGLDSDWASSAPSPMFSSLSRSGSVSGGSIFGSDAPQGSTPAKTPRKGRATHQTHTRGASSLSSPRKGNGSKLALEEKVAILRYIDMYPGVNQSVVAELFGVERSTVSKTKNDRQKYEVPWRESERGVAEAEDRARRGDAGPLDPFSPFLAVNAASSGAASRSKKAHARRQSESVLTKPAAEVDDEFKPKLSTKRQLAKSATAGLRSAELASQTPVKPAVIREEDEPTPTNSTTSSRATTLRHVSTEFQAQGLNPQQGLSDPSAGFGMPGGLVQDTPSRHPSISSLSSLASWSPTEIESIGYQQEFETLSQPGPALPSQHELSEPVQSPLIANATTLMQRTANYPDQGMYLQQPSYPAQQHVQYHPPRSGNTSPVEDSFHQRTGSTASSTSWQSGLTAFSSQNGNGSSLTSSVYGSVPAAGPHSRGGSPMPSGVACAPGHFFGQAPDEPGLVAGAAHPHPHAHAGPAPAQPRPRSEHAGRQATISGGPAFGERQQARRVSPTAKDGPSLAQAAASLDVAVRFLTSSAAQGLITPKDLIVLSDLQAKMATRAGTLPPHQPQAAQSGQQVRTASALGHRKAQSVTTGPSRAPLSRASSSSSIASFVSMASFSGTTQRPSGSGPSLLANFDGSAQLAFE